MTSVGEVCVFLILIITAECLKRLPSDSKLYILYSKITIYSGSLQWQLLSALDINQTKKQLAAPTMTPQRKTCRRRSDIY